MRLQGRALQAGMFGDDIGALHRELTTLGYEIPAGERDGQVFGVATAGAVARFQQWHGLPDTAVVNEATATAMEQVLASPAAETVVTRLPGAAEPAPPEPASDDPPDDAPAVGRAEVGDALNTRVEKKRLLHPDEAFRVDGRVASRVSAAVGGLRVVVVDKKVGGETPLAETSTDSDGYYQAAFSQADLRQRCAKEQPDLQARVFSGERFLQASEVRYDASAHETLNVFLDEQASRNLRSEYETLTAALSVHCPGSLGELQESGDRQDITYLANKSGWDARAVALAALADQFSARTAGPGADAGIEPPFFYALFRSRLPADEAAIYGVAPKAVAAILDRAVAQGVIPGSLRDRLPSVVERFAQMASQRLLADPPRVGVSSFKELVTLTLGDNVQRQQQFADLYTRYADDRAAFWDQVRGAFGEATANRLKLDGQLAYLTLNNAPLIGKLHQAAGQSGLADTSQLPELGFYHAGRWREVIGDDPVPPEITGEDGEQRDRYAALLAALVRLRNRTAVVAQMVKRQETPVGTAEARDAVHAFLSAHAGSFEIGKQPVAQYVARNEVAVDPAVIREVTRIQRVHQLAPGDEVMNALLKHGVDSAQAVVRYLRDDFVHGFKDIVGGEQNARLVHAKAQQVHAAVLNLAITYLTARSAPGIGVHSDPSIIDPRPRAHAGDVLAIPTLESMFREMDYCTCEHCRSVLSPAAYLVDLLMFIDSPVTEAADESANPQQVLLQRRPDLENLPLTCENTNIPLPYIDLVNETLEHYVANGLSLADYPGHSTDGGASPEELLASPQFVGETAYLALAEQHFPPPLPFHQPLAELRRYFGRFEAPLPQVMAALRTDDRLDRADDGGYGWRDIWLETLGLSRAEHRLLTDGWVTGGAPDVMLTVKHLYGFEPLTAEARVRVVLDNAKQFCRRVGISYQQLADILRTRAVNPHSHLLPRLERLGVTFATLKALKDGAITDEEFEAMLADGLDPAQYGGDIGIAAWVKDDDNYRRIASLVTLIDQADPDDPEKVCSFDEVELRGATGDPVDWFVFIRLIRFIRLWRTLGWSIAQTDQAVAALYPAEQAADDPGDASGAANLERLDAGFLELLPRLGVVRRVLDLLGLTPERDLPRLLACFAPIDTHGESSLYRRMFLGLSQPDEAFRDDGYGNYLPDDAGELMPHAATLRAAFSLTADELGEIIAALGYDDDDPGLTIETISEVFRRGWLARTLRLSVRELLLLTQFSGHDPFEPPDPVAPGIVGLIELVGRLGTLGITPAQVLYLIWNQDLSGTSTPAEEEITGFARTLRAGSRAVESEYALVDDPDDAVARTRMAQVYGSEATDLFFGLLDNTFVTEVEYGHDRPRLERPILDAAPGRIGYDDFRKRLSYAGVMSEDARDALVDAGLPATEVDNLYAENQAVVGPFFDQFPKLQQLYEDYQASTDPAGARRTALLEALLRELKSGRKRQQALQLVGTAADAGIELASALLADHQALHAAGELTRPALDDLTALETAGLTVTVTGRPDLTGTAANLRYAPGTNPLPGTEDAPISGRWTGYLEPPENGHYNISIVTDPAATVRLALNRKGVPLADNDGTWRNTESIDLRAGTLYPISLTVENVRERLAVRWQSAGRGSEIIPARYLYPDTLVRNLHLAYVRFRKAAALAAALNLTAAETAHLATDPDYRHGTQGWLNRLPVTGSPDTATATALRTALDGLLDFCRIKADHSPGDERLLRVLQDPEAVTAGEESLLHVLTRWEPGSLHALRDRFGADLADLTHLPTFRRVHDAYRWVKKLGIPAASLIRAATNEPAAAAVRELRAALRARYDESRWLEVLRPISDDMRTRRRDALVAYILHQMRSNTDSAHIDTPEKLYEYFLMDVQMDPCMLTSRIRHAISSVQLFIERCLMGLEGRVTPDRIKNAKRWEWMKRYRVWEANRKVFLFPENWLEPELRDNQSPIFKETMSELLQGDITEERAARALVGYLTKLEEVAKLEVCGVHYEEASTGTDDEVVHVVARTAGANRKYFYRRREHGSWTPWEKITLDIDDNPVLPVVWNNRLFLFWLKIVQKPKPGKSPDPEGELVQVDASEMLPSEPTRVTVKVILHWSERIEGEWQPTRTSDPANPLKLDDFEADKFDRAQLGLFAWFGRDRLHMLVSTQGTAGDSFDLYNTFSTPHQHFYSYPPSPTRELDASRGLRVTYPGSGPPHDVLESSAAGRAAIQPRQDPLAGEPWNPPFFYEDKRHVFYVTTQKHPILVYQGDGFGIYDWIPAPLDGIRGIEILSDGNGPSPFRIPELEHPPLIEEPLFGGADPAAGRFVTEDANINIVIGAPGTVSFGDREIGPLGGQLQPGDFR